MSLALPDALAQAPAPAPSEARRALEEIEGLQRRVREALRERIVGLEEVAEQVLVAVLTRNHVLLEGVPGLAKTLLLSSVAQLLDLTFSRIQFTPDLMPSDVTGSEFLFQDAASGVREFRFARGPVFANVVLADEINRAPPKTQAALMEAMEERQVTSLGVSRPLDEPFFVLATQNPIEQEGTYPLPAAQLDRFLFKVRIDYPSWADEERIARLTARAADLPLATLVSREGLRAMQAAVVATPVPAEVTRYAVSLIQASRPTSPTAPPLVREYVEWGGGPRAAQALVVAARARALLRGRLRADPGDVAHVAPPVLRHRLILSYAGQADGMEAEAVIAALLEHVVRPGESPRAGRSWWRRLLRARRPVAGDLSRAPPRPAPRPGP